MAEGSIRILVVDDEPLVRRGLQLIMNAEPDLTVVGEAGDGAEALSQVRELAPDVVCMDVRMPGVDGIRATELILNLPTPPKVLVITTFENDQYVSDALLAGAAGFLLKRASAEEMIQAVRTVAGGQSLLFPEAVRALVQPTTQPDSYHGPDLTPREQQVLELIAQGLTNAEIAAELIIGSETVRTHVSGLLAKLQARDRTQAAVIGLRTGLVT